MSPPQQPSNEFEASLERWWRAGLGGTLVVSPIIVGGLLGVANWVLVTYLFVVTAVLAVVVVRGRLRRGRI